jgi:hypothetical protein
VTERDLTTTYDLAEELTILPPKGVRLFYDEFEDLCLELDGAARQPVKASRVFPVSVPDRFVALTDKEGVEVGILSDVSALDEASRQALSTELERDYFHAQITRVLSMTAGGWHTQEWEVETDRGTRAFEIRSNRRDIRHLGGGRILIKDADGNRFEIPDYRTLDPFSRDLIDGQI